MNRSEALALLNSLGDTPEQVADALLAQKIKGIPGSTADCPISNCLRSHGAICVDTTPRRIFLQDWSDDLVVQPPRAVAIYGIPEAISQFIKMFDEGKFPNLEDK
jgi:hypothetical protein